MSIGQTQKTKILPQLLNDTPSPSNKFSKTNKAGIVIVPPPPNGWWEVGWRGLEITKGTMHLFAS